MSARWRLVPLLLALSACAIGGEGERAATASWAELDVRVYSGLHRPQAPAPASRVHVMVDVSSLPDGPDFPDPRDTDALALARKLSGDLIPGGGAPIEVHTFEGLAGGECPNRPERGTAASQSLQRVTQRTAREEPGAADRAVLIVDLETECEVTLCEASRALVAQGTWLDVVALGPASLPLCLSGLRPPVQPGPVLRSMTAPAPRFQVQGSADSGALLAQGRAGAGPLRVPPGLVRVQVELDPAERVGPILLAPGERATIRIMDFPLSAPAARSWVVERAGAP